MSTEVIIHNDDFEDANGELHYFNTGKENVSGLPYPEHYIVNEDYYEYVRLAEIRISSDNTLIYPLKESFILTCYSQDSDIILSTFINLEARVSEGLLKIDDTSCIITPLTNNEAIPQIIVSVQDVLENGNIIKIAGIWIYAKSIYAMNIKRIESLAFNEIPNNISTEYITTYYDVKYLNTEDIVYDVNMFRLKESIGTVICNGENINQEILDSVEGLNQDIIQAIPSYAFLTVVYDDLFLPTKVNTDEIIQASAFQYVEVGNSFAQISDGKQFVSVKEEGEYIIALKVNMDILDGNPAKMVMSLFLNDDRVEETTTTIYLNPLNKEYPLGFLSGYAQMHLTPTDRLYLKARFSDINDVNIENHCTLQITRLNIKKE